MLSEFMKVCLPLSGMTGPSEMNQNKDQILDPILDNVADSMQQKHLWSVGRFLLWGVSACLSSFGDSEKILILLSDT